jgi:hypothetical protein
MLKGKNRVVYVVLIAGTVQMNVYRALNTLCADYSGSLSVSHLSRALKKSDHYTNRRKEITIRRCELIDNQPRGNPLQGFIEMNKRKAGLG